MSAADNPLCIMVFAPALADGDGRTLAIVQGLERALPGMRLRWTLSEQGEPIAVPQRDAWLIEASAQRAFPMVCNGDERYPITLSGTERPACLSPGGHPLLEAHAQFPLDPSVVTAAEALMEALSEGAHAFWGRATPFRPSVEIAEQTAPTIHGPPWRSGPPAPPRGLPPLKLFDDIRAPEIPFYLGWINYWSPATAQTMGFPNPSLDVELLSRSRRTASGAWIVRLTDAPLDLDIPSHLEILKRTYARFPEIGGRAGPAT